MVSKSLLQYNNSCFLNFDNKSRVTKQCSNSRIHGMSELCYCCVTIVLLLFGYKSFKFIVQNARVLILFITQFFFVYVLKRFFIYRSSMIFPIVMALVHMAVKYGALLTQIHLDLEMELYLRTEFTQISLVKNYILNFVNLFQVFIKKTPTLLFCQNLVVSHSITIL